MFTLDSFDIEEVYYFPLLEGVVKESIKLFHHYLKAKYSLLP